MLGVDYADHAKETGHRAPSYPALFLRVKSSLVSAGALIVRPRASGALDYEAELLVIIGTGGRNIPAADALQHVFGYTCFNDGSLRDFQSKSSQWTPGKNFDKTGAVGPVVTTADELPAGARDLRITCKLNGSTVQDANTADMIVDVAHAVELVSAFMTLEPGDLVAMGTPDGVGMARKPMPFLKHGDTVEVEIGPMRVLSNLVADEVQH